MADTWKINSAAEGAEEIGQKAAARVEDERVQAVAALETAAYRLEAKRDDAGGAIANFACKTAEYLKNNDPKAIMKDVEYLVRRYPAQFVAAGIVLGFFLARSFRSTDS